MNNLDRARDDYLEAMAGIENLLMKETSYSKLLYVGELLGGSSFSPKMVRKSFDFLLMAAISSHSAFAIHS